jgi:hypothetical protein
MDDQRIQISSLHSNNESLHQARRSLALQFELNMQFCQRPIFQDDIHSRQFVANLDTPAMGVNRHLLISSSQNKADVHISLFLMDWTGSKFSKKLENS